MGLALGAAFRLTGSLAGPLTAHAVINGFNLAYLKRHDPAEILFKKGEILLDVTVRWNVIDHE